MKVKVGTQLEEEILSDLKVRAAREKKPMSDIIQEAVLHYLNDRKTVERSESLLRILDNPSQLPDEVYGALIEADFYDQSA